MLRWTLRARFPSSSSVRPASHRCARSRKSNSSEGCIKRRRTALNDFRNGGNVVQVDHRNAGIGQGLIGRDGNDARVVGMQKRLTVGPAKDFKLEVLRGLETLDHDEVTGRYALQKVRQCRLGILTHLMHLHPAPR